MRIALVTETYTPEINGVAKTLNRLVDELSARDHDIHIIRPRQKQDNATFHIQLTLVKGLSIPGYSGLQFGLPAGRLLNKLWQTEQPDIVYVATEGPLGWSAVTTANRLNIPVISGFHTNFHSYSKHYHIGWLEKLIFGYLRRLHNKTLCTLAPSPELAEQLNQQGIHNTRLFSRGVDTRACHPEHRSDILRNEWLTSPDGCVALYVGRIAAEKNINLVIHSYQKMKQLQPALTLVIVGDGPLRNKLERQHPDIVFTGPKTGIELSRHYASADCFLFASESETFGNVILEAMSSGLAVVAYDYAAARMHINHGHNGFAVSLGNAEAFTEAACTLMRNQQLTTDIGQQARRSTEQIDWTHVIDNFEKVMVNYAKPEHCSDNDSEKQPVPADGSA